MRQRRVFGLVVAAGLVGALTMSLATTSTVSAFVASVTDSTNTAATGALILQQTGSGGTCTSTDGGSVSTNAFATCTAVNLYGGSTTMLPSNAAGTTNTVATTTSFRNTGTGVATGFTMGFGACAQSANGSPSGSATDFCAKLRVRVASGATTVVADTTAAALAGATVTLPAALIPAANSGSATPFTVTTYVDAAAGNTYQGLAASQPVTWTLTS